MYRCEDGGRIKEVEVVLFVWFVCCVWFAWFVHGSPHVVQSSNGNFIIGHLSRDDDP